MRPPRGNAEHTALSTNALSSDPETMPNSGGRRPIAQDGFWTVKELARYLCISERWIHERTRRNEIPCHRLGTALRFDPQEVRMWMIQRRESGVGEPGAA